ncbi:hypothetical protein QYM36_011733, partial [Artemia franciscana]
MVSPAAQMGHVVHKQLEFKCKKEVSLFGRFQNKGKAVHETILTDREPRQPEFSEELVSSQSAVEGTTVKLQCKVKSDDEPFIQWLKRVESDNTQLFPISDAPITFGQWRYRVVRAGRVLTQTDDGAYIDRLVFEHISKDDSGTYICVATNSVGYSFREANVRVLPPPSNYA